ncbi:PAS domain S-box-containing protein [Chitinophaga skermanii]|uniref:histidine kinase n=1 Tax=Chitinophaga skermanii TaxID=331697 RepID=A0A327QCW8_9BACT|nr:PAS domain S-box protein [Chitinophaga skermanii]RAJ01644.1 PAS domain S-box-containing protein [Chitinophaga skermanii]
MLARKFISNPLFAVFIAALALISWFTYYIYENNQKALAAGNDVSIHGTTINHLETLYATMLEIESGSRGFLITGDSSFIPSEEYVHENIDERVQHLQLLLAKYPEDLIALDKLYTGITKKLVYMNFLIKERQVNNRFPTRFLHQRYGVGLMKDIKTLSLQLLAKAQERLLIGVRTDKYFTQQTYRFSIIASSATLILFLAAIVQLFRYILKNVRKEEALVRSEEKYRKLIDDAAVTMFTANRGGYFTYVSKQATEVTGYDTDELEGQHYSMFLNEEQFSKLRSFYLKQAEKDIPQTKREFQIKCKNGELKWVEQIVKLVWIDGEFRGFQCIVTDIDEQKKAQLSLKAAEEEMIIIQHRFQAILDNTTSLIYVKDVEGRYLMVNKQFEKVFQLDKTEICGKKDNELPAVFKSQRYAETDTFVINREMPAEVEDVVEFQSQKAYYLINKFPLHNQQNELFGICGIATDITDRITYEHEVMEARTKAESAMRTQEIFMANMSHEIRTPMHGIIMNGNLLLHETLTPLQQEYLGAIRESANNLMTIINDLLDFEKIRSGTLALTPKNIDICFLTAKLLIQYQEKAAAKGLSLKYFFDEKIPHHLLADPLRTKQILQILLNNAVKFTNEGHIILLIRVVEEVGTQVKLSFEISDTGIGIPDEKQSDIFNSFTQTNSSNSRSYGGAGLGLAICKHLVGLLKGDISVQSTLGKGSTFKIILPFEKPLLQEPAQQVQLPINEVSLKGKRILVAEDNLINQKAMLHLLKRAEVEVLMANNGLEAIALVQQHHVDCILMDIQMPTLDGYAAAEQIRQLGYKLPIIAVTASAIRGERERCIQAGMNDYLSKPFSESQLFSIIQHYLPPPSEPIIEAGKLKEFTKADKHYMDDIVQIFIAESHDMLYQLKSAADEQNWSEVRFIAHKLKSSLTVVRIPALMELILQLELRATDNPNEHSIQADIAQLQSTFEEVKNMLLRDAQQN